MQNLPFADPETPWSFTAADADAIIEKYGWEGMKKAHLVVDVSEGSVPEKKAAYKFPIAKIIDGRLKIVPRAIFAAAAYLNGARGVEVSLPEDVKEKLKSRLAQYYHKLDRKAPWEEKGFLRRIAEFFGLVEKREEVEDVSREELEKAIQEALEKRLGELKEELKGELESVSAKVEELQKGLSERVEKLEKSDELAKVKEELGKLAEDVKLLKSVIVSKAQQPEKKEEESVFKGIL